LDSTFEDVVKNLATDIMPGDNDPSTAFLP